MLSPTQRLASDSVGRTIRESRWAFALWSIAVAIPCFWQSRLQAGDLSSHLYNAWLAQLIGIGQAPGLSIAPQFTNVLFDRMVAALFDAFGAEAAQRIPVACAVLVFVWGAFAFASRLAGRRVWDALPVIAMLAYGWTFHMGLFNFYLSLGICFWAMTLAWTWRPRGMAVAAVLIAAACTAHGLPVAWALAVLAYHAAAGRIAPENRWRLLAGSLAAMAAGSWLIRTVWSTRWIAEMQVRSTVAADQFWVYDGKYLAVSAGVLLVWGLALAPWMRACGAKKVASGAPFQLCVLTAAGILLTPTWMRVPGYSHALVYIPDRMSLALGVCLCGLAGAAAVQRPLAYAAGGLAILYFGLLYADERALNSLEDRMERLVGQLPAGQRVVSAIDGGQRVNAVTHMIDRVCVGRCYSYGNYEPASGQFRVRVTGASPLALAGDADVNGLAAGTYTVQARDVPLYQVLLDANGKMAIRSLQAGQVSGMTTWH